MPYPVLAALIAAGLVVGSCARLPATVEIESNVETYSEFPVVDGATVAVVPLREELRPSLQFKAMADHLEERLAAEGLRVVEAEEDADYIAVFDYAIDDGRELSEAYAVPRFGFARFHAPHLYGWHRYPYWHGARWGVVGYTTRERHWREYARDVSLTIIDQPASTPGDPVVVYEGLVASTGTCGRISEVLPHLLDAMFAEFPKSTSGLQVVTLPAGLFDC